MRRCRGCPLKSVRSIDERSAKDAEKSVSSWSHAVKINNIGREGSATFCRRVMVSTARLVIVSFDVFPRSDECIRRGDRFRDGDPSRPRRYCRGFCQDRVCSSSVIVTARRYRSWPSGQYILLLVLHARGNFHLLCASAEVYFAGQSASAKYLPNANRNELMSAKIKIISFLISTREHRPILVHIRNTFSFIITRCCLVDA